jgi:hypothetical protein
MRIAANPFLTEGVLTSFTQPGLLRSCLILPGALGLVLPLWWPRGALETALREGHPQDVCTAVSLAFLLCTAYLGARHESHQPERRAGLHEYVTLTPVRLSQLVGGKIGFAILHTGFLLLLGSPFLLASLAVSGEGLERGFASLAVIGAAGLALRMLGLLLLAVMEAQRLVRGVMLLFAAAGLLGLPMLMAPAASPVSALLSLAAGSLSAGGPTREIMLGAIPAPFFMASVAIDLAAATVLGAGTFAWLALARARARRRGRA